MMYIGGDIAELGATKKNEEITINYFTSYCFFIV